MCSSRKLIHTPPREGIQISCEWEIWKTKKIKEMYEA